MDDPPESFRGTGGRSTFQQIVRAHKDDFLAQFEDEHGGRSLPAYVIKEFDALFECGDPAFGFTRIRCPSCGLDAAVRILSWAQLTFPHALFGRRLHHARHFRSPVFLPADPLTSDEVQRVHTNVIARIRRVVERYDLDPIALGLTPRAGDEPLATGRIRNPNPHGASSGPAGLRDERAPR